MLMTRAGAKLPAAEALLTLIDAAGRLALRVKPGAKVEGLEIADGRLLAKVRAQPESGKANAAVRRPARTGAGHGTDAHRIAARRNRPREAVQDRFVTSKTRASLT
jgi:hypothetical protein